MLTDVRTCSMTTAALNADIETLTAVKGSLASVPLEAAFESVVSILGLARVCLPSALFLAHFLTMRPGRAHKRRRIRRVGPVLCQNVPRVEISGGREQLGCVERIR